MVSLIEFIKLVSEDDTKSRKKHITALIGFALASVYLFSGIYYAVHIYFGGSFWF